MKTRITKVDSQWWTCEITCDECGTIVRHYGTHVQGWRPDIMERDFCIECERSFMSKYAQYSYYDDTTAIVMKVLGLHSQTWIGNAAPLHLETVDMKYDQPAWSNYEGESDMADSVGKRPVIDSHEKALQVILTIAGDKRTHVLMADHIEWMELKMKEIRRIARAGLKTE